jgi:hypothetical protein
MSFFEEIPKEEWYSRTVNELKKYPSMKLAVQAADLQDQQDLLNVKRRKVMLIDLALSPLTPEEKKIIELSYFTRHKPKDVNIQQQIGMSHSYFYNVKDEVMRHIATVLNIL